MSTANELEFFNDMATMVDSLNSFAARGLKLLQCTVKAGKLPYLTDRKGYGLFYMSMDGSTGFDSFIPKFLRT